MGSALPLQPFFECGGRLVKYDVLAASSFVLFASCLVRTYFRYFGSVGVTQEQRRCPMLVGCPPRGVNFRCLDGNREAMGISRNLRFLRETGEGGPRPPGDRSTKGPGDRLAVQGYLT